MNNDYSVIIECGSKKELKPCEAEKMYIGSAFVLQLQAAKKTKRPYYITSAKYGLIEPSRIISPYNSKLRSFTKEERKDWAELVKEQSKIIIKTKKIVLFCGSYYAQPFCDLDYEILTPLKGLGIGYRMQYFKKIVMS